MIHDLRYALRSIARMPALAAVVVASLGVGIGVNTIVFSWIDAVLLRPLPGVRGAAAFHFIEPRNQAGMYVGMSWLEYRDLRERVRSIDEPLAFRMIPLYVGEAGRVERGNGMLVSGNYFASLGLRPALGRFLRPEETSKAGAEPVAVISYEFWQTRFAGAPTIVGQTIRLNGHDVTIIGVAPPGFRGTIMRLSFDLWLPATFAPVLLDGSRELEERGLRGYTMMGRLTAPATRAGAQAEADAAMRDLARTYPQTNASLQADVLPFTRAPRGPQRLLAASLAFLQALMLLLLVAMCGNTANLVLARASARQREMSVRLALGAGRWRVARLLLTENLLLAIGGAAVGAGIAIWGTNTLSAFPPMHVRGIPIVFDTVIDGAGLAVAIALGVCCGLAFGAAPALQLSRVDPQLTLRAGASTAPRGRLRNALMAVEVGIALVVLVVAGLFFRSFQATREADPGFRRDGVLLTAYDLSGRRTTESVNRAFAATVLQRVRAIPAVQSAAIASSVPLDIHGLPVRGFAIEGRARPDGTEDEALANTVTPGYFEVMGIPLRAGTDFADLNDTTSPPQAIVNEEFVRRYLDGREPLGRRIESRGRMYLIVGVARNSLYNAFGDPPLPIIYYSYRDRPVASGELHLRAKAGPEGALASGVRRAVREMDPELPLYDVRTLNDHIDANLIFRRVPARMFAVAGPLLLILAAIGIYAVVAYTVSLRIPEIGVRLALGATARRIVAGFVGESMSVIGVGALAGWVLAFVVALDFLAGPVDVAVFAGVPAVLLAVGAAASWFPARRAARTDPMTALRKAE